MRDKKKDMQKMRAIRSVSEIAEKLDEKEFNKFMGFLEGIKYVLSLNTKDDTGTYNEKES